MAELSDSQIWTALAGANGTADRKPLWGDSVELGQVSPSSSSSTQPQP
jgi:hypothetical protein